MGKRFSYSIPAMTRRLLKIAGPVKGTLWISTLASIVGNLSQMGLMGFGALLLLSCAGMVGGPPWVYALCGGLPAFGQHAGAFVWDHPEAGASLPDGPGEGRLAQHCGV